MFAAIPRQHTENIERWAENATPLELDQALRLAVHDKNTRTVAVLLRRGAYVNTMRLPRENSDDSDTFKDFRTIDLSGPSLDTSGGTYHQQRVLHEAYENNDLEITELLLRARADISRPYHIVFNAALRNNLDMIRIFSKYIDFNTHRNPEGQTVLYAVLKYMHYSAHDLTQIIEFLISQKANVDVQSGIYRQAILRYGYNQSQPPIYLPKTNIHTCVSQDLAGLKLLMKHYVDINCITNQGSPLRLAIAIHSAANATRKPYRRQFIRDILEYNVDFDFHDEKVTWSWFSQIGRGGYVPPPPADDVRDLVDWFRHRQSMEYLSTLTTQQAMDSTDVWGKTALHRAVENAQVHQVKLLLENGADYEIPDHWGHTPYQTVVRRHYNYSRKVQRREYFIGPGSLAFGHNGEIGMVNKIRALKRIRNMLLLVINRESGLPKAF
jgi:ankyrin repeat protein